MRTLIPALTSVALLSGCTHWGTATVYGPKHEVERRLLGEPSLATTSSSNLSAGFAGSHGNGLSLAGLDAGTDSMSRTHCVQQAEIVYEQPYELQPVPEGRAADVAGAVVLGFVGLGVMVAAKISSETIFEPGDPLYEEPPSPVGGYLVGGAMIAGGVGLLAYSFNKLPKAPKPAVQQSKRNWTQNELVEATGCTMPGQNVASVPQPQAQPQPAPQPQPLQTRPLAQPAAATVAPQPAAAATGTPSNDAAMRLKKLDDLRASGAITESEYQKKRKQIIDSI
jgi:hypothetical protein